MSTPEVLKVCAGIYLVLIIVDLVRSRRLGRAVAEIVLLVGLIVMDILIASASAGYITFGSGISQVWVVVIMIPCVMLGTAAHFIFYRKGTFDWGDFLRPLVISPLVLLTMFGTVLTGKNAEPIQV